MASTRSVAEKMGIVAGSRALLVGAPDDAVRAMALPDLDLRARREFAHIHLFVVQAEELEREFARLAPLLAEGGRLWVSWPKARGLGTDLTIKNVIRIGYDAGMVESTAVSVNVVWSALKFTRPKPGKVYANSYGTLRD